jgi:4-aminobutyrate aminotransferase/4-aminobutyrate aminotransferase/(S)-3-amino-2-methylpropionate transaminase
LKTETAMAVANFDRIRPPHGMGLMIGLFVHDRSGTADPALCDLILENLKDNGVFAGKTGAGRSTLTLMPPLTVSDNEIGEFIVALRKSVAAIR